MNTVRTTFPDIWLHVSLLIRHSSILIWVYLSSRIYGGWAKVRLNPEPYAYESNFAVKWLARATAQGRPRAELRSRQGAGEVALAELGAVPLGQRLDAAVQRRLFLRRGRPARR